MVTVGQHSRIVVGVDGSSASRNAVLWAAEEARLRRLSLIITSIAPVGAGVGSEWSWSVERNVLSAAAAAASSREPAIAVGTQLLTGDVGDELIRLTRSASVLVVAVDRSRPRAAHGMIGALEDRVVAHGDCPVVVVSHQPALREAPCGSVVVGLADSEYSHSVLEAAAVEADARGAALSVVTDGPAVRHVDGAESTEGDRAVLDAVEDIRRTHPSLQVTINTSARDLAIELQRQSTDADLLVVGCDQSRDRWSIHIGPLAVLLTRTSGCPVMLVGPSVARARSHYRPVA